MPRGSVDLPLVLDRDLAEPLTVQLTDQLRAAMRSGAVEAGERLPSTRELARILGVSRTVVTDAYEQLYAEGWLEGRHGSGTFVADVLIKDLRSGAAERPGPTERAVERAKPEIAADLRPGRAWVRDIDPAVWRRAWRLVADYLPGDEPDPYGLPGLRRALAEHLRRARGIHIGPESVMVTRSTANGIDMIGATLVKPGDRVGVEEPGYIAARTVLRARGAEVVPCAVDEHGVVVEELPADLTLIYTTPAHQYPLGGRLPVPRRGRLLDWARRTGAYVVEDDYDAEFRYDVAPLPALYSLDPDRVILLGTLSKSFVHDLGIGWLVTPPRLLRRIAHTRLMLDDRTPGPTQEAARILLERGDLDRHLRRMRLEYGRRRAAVVEALGDVVRLRGETAGLHVVAELPAQAVRRVVREAAEQGILLDTLERHHGGPSRVHGLVIGYGSASLTEIKRACPVLRRILAGSAPSVRERSRSPLGGEAPPPEVSRVR
ncbi:PLP-dependent aminotransferase family protein [Rhizohabitans arisaemae]|uniref:MocR-like pyridoxine biosynthesis transcription factor PdxR n=1 Tax=Rhizohabitans arisaemae TaxID=2720610 RepID=UPI0024B27DE7|nr:PLP-dependent aminotransferase family protein [Rhizohabitans arisaemae]